MAKPQHNLEIPSLHTRDPDVAVKVEDKAEQENKRAPFDFLTERFRLENLRVVEVVRRRLGEFPLLVFSQYLL